MEKMEKNVIFAKNHPKLKIKYVFEQKKKGTIGEVPSFFIFSRD